MKATEILHKDIVNAYPEIHKIRLNTLFTFVRSGLRDTYLIRVIYKSGMPIKVTVNLNDSNSFIEAG
ncbi:hypothetical protein [Colwellia sp. E150_009]|jgi:hypothetical protein